MVIEIDRTKWEVPRNRLPPRHHSAEKQLAIRKQVNKLLELGVIDESTASEWSQVHPVPKSDGSRRLTIDFVQLNAAIKGLEGWPIPNILETLTRLGTLKPTCFGLNEVSSDSLTPRVTCTHRIPRGGRSISMDTGCYGTERSWPLLSTQYAEQGP